MTRGDLTSEKFAVCASPPAARMQQAGPTRARASLSRRLKAAPLPLVEGGSLRAESPPGLPLLDGRGGESRVEQASEPIAGGRGASLAGARALPHELTREGLIAPVEVPRSSISQAAVCDSGSGPGAPTQSRLSRSGSSTKKKDDSASRNSPRQSRGETEKRPAPGPIFAGEVRVGQPTPRQAVSGVVAIPSADFALDRFEVRTLPVRVP